MNRADGWIPYSLWEPAAHVLVRFWNELTGKQWTGYADEAQANTSYLWWKLTAIERFEGELWH